MHHQCPECGEAGTALSDMRCLTVMQQYVKGLAHHNPAEAEAIARLLRQIKGFIWNGNLHDGQTTNEDRVIDLENVNGLRERSRLASIPAIWRFVCGGWF
jgi:hypothetical protein